MASLAMAALVGDAMAATGVAAAAEGAVDYAPSNPLFPPARLPPLRAVLPAASALLRPLANPIDIGACERDTAGAIFADGFAPSP